MGLRSSTLGYRIRCLKKKNKLNRISVAISMLRHLEKEVLFWWLATKNGSCIPTSNASTWKEANEPANSIAKAELHLEKILLYV